MERGGYAPPEPTSEPAPALTAIDEHPLTAEDCAIGEVIAGKYLVEGVIGRGSMGVVVRATHLGFDELVALKFIRPEMRKLDGIVSRFAREAKASVRIRNEHAVNVLDVGVADPIGPFFAMEYLEGINLEELVDSQGAFDTATAVKYVLEACEALAAAHAQGIIHRDIKPQNMFLAWQGRLEIIKLLDFGISKAALSGQVFGDDLSSGEKDWVMGTPLYMSPEQLRHAPDVDERTDIWSIGAVLYELLCGQPLFSGNTQTQVSRQVLEAGDHPVRVVVPGVPDELWSVIERCLSQDKEQRYPNVAELGEALLPFAPAGSCLHVERARALLGLRPMNFFGADDDIEDIDVDPIEEESARHAAPLGAATKGNAPANGSAAGSGPRRPLWVEIALPALACVVAWLAHQQSQMSAAVSARSDDAIQTVALALRQRTDCPLPATAPAAVPPEAREAAASAPNAAPPSNAGPQPQTALPGSAPAGPAPQRDAASQGAVGEGGPLATGSTEVTGAAPTTPSAPPAPSGDGAPAFTPSPLVAQHASGARRDLPRAPTAPVTAATPGPSEAPRPSPPPGADTAAPNGPASASARRVNPPKPRVEPPLQFRLIDEDPRSGFQLVPGADPARASAPPATP